MSESVLQVLLRRLPRMRSAVLRGYRRYKLEDRCYPAVVPRLPSDAVCGVLLCELRKEEIEMLNAFEDPAYERRFVPVWLTDAPCPSAVEALAYVRASDAHAELFGDWSLGDFENSSVYADYLDRCRYFRSGFEVKK